MKSLVVGAGQIGKALHEIFSKYHECLIRDVDNLDVNDVKVLHIAFPYDENFLVNVREYLEKYKPELTIIHSSVAVGTTRQLGKGVVHSPERGRWPNLAFEMKQFEKFVGTTSQDDMDKACQYFLSCEWSVVPIGDPDITEALKLISNVHLGLEIAWRQEVDRMLGGKTIAYDLWEDSYNKGHVRLGHRQLLRSRVSPKTIGGHCILPCMDILQKFYESEAFSFIRRSNAKRHTEQKASIGSREAETVAVSR